MPTIGAPLPDPLSLYDCASNCMISRLSQGQCVEPEIACVGACFSLKQGAPYIGLDRASDNCASLVRRETDKE
jgi:hypothetical protein